MRSHCRTCGSVGARLTAGLQLCPPVQVRLGGLGRDQLVAALTEAGVQLNASAELLLRNDVFDRPQPGCVNVVHCTVRQLGLPNGGSLSAILGTAQARGLSPCPAITGPYLRLVMTRQTSAPDSVMSNGSAPSGSLTVAAVPLDEGDDVPKGFYLRVVDGVSWLRGYHASEQHIWSPDDSFAFSEGEPTRWW